jgi:osmotically-inducible protein OsmY
MSGIEFNLECLVSEAILIADTLGSAVIEVKDDDGVVTLKGTVESEQDKIVAEDLARHQEGVLDVVNNLRALRY